MLAFIPSQMCAKFFWLHIFCWILG